MSEKITNNSGTDNGIIKQIYKGEKFNFWYNADVVRPYILGYLIKTYPESIIIQEFNYIDMVILDQNMPVEIQSTVVSHPGRGGQGLNHSEFEQKIEKQLKQNIERYGRCIFFFDAEYLRYFQVLATKNTRINLDWFYQYIKDEKLKVFAVKFDGTINDTTMKDFEFILKLSSLTKKNILDRNKFKIMSKVLKWYKFSTQEINYMYNKFKKEEHEYKSFYKWLARDNASTREFLLMYVYGAIAHLEQIDSMLNCEIIDQNSIKTISRDAQKLGLMDSRDTGKSGYMRIFTDYPDIAQLFPGYLNKKDLWNGLKNRYISFGTLCGIVSNSV